MNSQKKNKNLKQTDLVVWVEKTFNKKIHRTTVSKILSSDIILNENTDNFHRSTQVKYPQLEEKLKIWFFKYENLTTISNLMIIEKAKQFAQQLSIPEGSLNFSDGWLSSFKRRNKIKRITTFGESGSANLNYIESELPEILSKIKNFNPNDVFNFDETALFYKLEPDKTLATKRLEGRKKNKERITVGFCVNSTGTEKMVPVIIGKYLNPRCFKNINLTNVGIKYFANTKAWMTITIFRNWLITFDKLIRISNPKRKVLLILDNAGCHKLNGLELKNVEILFLPPNTTTKLQPLDAGIIASFKAKYRQKLIRFLLNNIETQPLIKQSLSLLEAIRFIVKSWDEVTEDTIKHCWNHTKLINYENITFSVSTEESELSTLITSLNSENPMTAQQYLKIPEENIIEDLLDEEFDQTESDSEEVIEESVIEKIIPNSDALNACNTLINYFEQQSDNHSSHVRDLRQIHSIINNIVVNSKKQTSILDYFQRK